MRLLVLVSIFLFNFESVIKEGIKQGTPWMFVEDESLKVMKQAGKSAEFVKEVLRAKQGLE